jgi:drug/metabolite transporter (DMT)-like permease
MWLVFALLAPLFFAIVHILDAYCVEDVFEKPWMGVVTGALSSAVIILGPLPFIIPFTSWVWPPLNIILIALIAGVLIQISQALYFQSLSYSEAGIIGAYWNMIPAMVPILSFIFLREVLTPSAYIGISILIFASTYILLLDSNREFRTKSLVLMIFACLMQAISYLLLDHSYSEASYAIIFYLMTIGLISAGILPLILKSVRTTFQKNLPQLLPAAKFFIAVELANIIALACAQKAVDLGNPSLVAAIETTIPAFIIIISIFLLGLTAEKFGDTRTRFKIQYKLAAVTVMVVGVFLIS